MYKYRYGQVKEKVFFLHEMEVAIDLKRLR